MSLEGTDEQCQVNDLVFADALSLAEFLKVLVLVLGALHKDVKRLGPKSLGGPVRVVPLPVLVERQNILSQMLGEACPTLGWEVLLFVEKAGLLQSLNFLL